MSGGLFPNREVDVSTTSSVLLGQVRLRVRPLGRILVDDAKDWLGETSSCHENLLWQSDVHAINSDRLFILPKKYL